MFFWFIGTAIVAIWFVFRDPRFDVRPVAVGAVLPELDVVFGGARVLHTLVFSVALMVVVVLGTVHRRRGRRLLLGVPIGTFLHLVFDGVWTNTHLFWWPFGGWRFDGARLPSAERGWWNVAFEAAGIAMIVWFTGRRADPRPSRPNRPERLGTAARPDRRTAR